MAASNVGGGGGRALFRTRECSEGGEREDGGARHAAGHGNLPSGVIGTGDVKTIPEATA